MRVVHQTRKEARSDVLERLVPLGNYVYPIESPPGTPQIARHYSIVGLKGTIDWSPFVPRDASRCHFVQADLARPLTSINTKKILFPFNLILREYDHTDNFLLVMNQTKFRLVHNQQKIVDTIIFL